MHSEHAHRRDGKSLPTEMLTSCQVWYACSANAGGRLYDEVTHQAPTDVDRGIETP